VAEYPKNRKGDGKNIQKTEKGDGILKPAGII
jgi:hypothetical protein